MENMFLVSRIGYNGKREFLTFGGDWTRLISEAILFNVFQAESIVNGLKQLEKLARWIEYDYSFDEVKDIINE